jgi:hypothetical protein
LVGIPEGNRLLERPGRRWEDDIRMHIYANRMRIFGLNLSDSEQGPVAVSCGLVNEPCISTEAEKILTSCVIISFSRKILLHGASYLVITVDFDRN